MLVDFDGTLFSFSSMVIYPHFRMGFFGERLFEAPG
jgi:hypothetical protein